MPSQEFLDYLEQIDSKTVTELSRVEQTIRDVNRFNFEITLGGLSGFFYNSTGERWKETLRALDRVGASGAHELLCAAIESFQPGAPAPGAMTEEIEEQLDLLSRRFGTGTQALLDLLETYWRRGPDSAPR